VTGCLNQKKGDITGRRCPWGDVHRLTYPSHLLDSPWHTRCFPAQPTQLCTKTRAAKLTMFSSWIRL